MGLIGAVNWLKASLLILSQVLAGIASAGVVSALFSGPLAVRTTLAKNTSVVRGLFIEMFLTFELIFCIFMLAAEKHRSTFLAPIGIGLALFVAELAGKPTQSKLFSITLRLAGVLFTGGSLNPARSFGPDVILRTFDGYHWIYWVGPLLGAILAVIFYRLIKVLEYETANPDADGDGRELHHGGRRVPTDYDDARSQCKSSPIQGGYRSLCDTDSCIARRTTDGTDETDFATRLQSAKRNPVAPSRHTMTSHYNTTLLDSTTNEKPSQPSTAFRYGGDGHRSDSSLDHPNDRPRAQHTRSSRRSSQYYEMTPSNNSYRSGPSAESGRSSS